MMDKYNDALNKLIDLLAIRERSTSNTDISTIDDSHETIKIHPFITVDNGSGTPIEMKHLGDASIHPQTILCYTGNKQWNDLMNIDVDPIMLFHKDHKDVKSNLYKTIYGPSVNSQFNLMSYVDSTELRNSTVVAPDSIRPARTDTRVILMVITDSEESMLGAHVRYGDSTGYVVDQKFEMLDESKRTLLVVQFYYIEPMPANNLSLIVNSELFTNDGIIFGYGDIYRGF